MSEALTLPPTLRPALVCRVSFVALLAWVLMGQARPGLCACVAAWALATALSRAAMG